MDYIKRILIGILRRAGGIIPDKLQIEAYYRLEMGKKLDLKRPKTMNEKLQWLKLYSRKEMYRPFVDKIKVKEIVAKKIGKKYVVPILGVWDSFDDIDFDKLPEKFVLKTNHSGGNVGVVIVPDKSKLNISKAKEKLERSLKSDIYRSFREWPYKGMKKKIFAEEYLGSALVDYKFYCFDGDADCVLLCIDRQTGAPKFYFISLIRSGNCAGITSEAKKRQKTSRFLNQKELMRCFGWPQRCRKVFRLYEWTSMM